ncbi:PEPxxWA-CTERM sorting domain-containing protein [Sandarakinorhabdus sp. AAP62]|uniref:PEPxxWA-CTERM sorting domain-containing protein n=1 Tax=Sandarakinorhabdus sp. AAP62 TaxID=1248916 RepID=UPI0002F6180C|nr:PEPxxWA-CTERM sorting domain-containing protein [Sandarakinorhabdus sp. AAP62]
MKRIMTSAALLAALAAGPAQASFFADSLVSAVNTTSFGSGLVTGAPDGGGLFIGSDSDPPTFPGQFTVGFSTALGDGAGADLRLYELASSANETFDLFVSSDNINFTLIGGFNATNAFIDFNGQFAGPVSFVKIVNSSTVVSADFDAIEGLYAFNGGAVPEPGSWAMMLAGFGLVGAALRRRTVAIA